MRKLSVILLVILICVITFFQTGCTPDKNGCVHVSWLDVDSYRYSDKIDVVGTHVDDYVQINYSSDKNNPDWEWILQGYIRRFTYHDGILYMEFYDKWFTFNVTNYEPGSSDYELKQYDSEEDVRKDCNDFDDLTWETVIPVKDDKMIKENNLSEDYKTTSVYERNADGFSIKKADP